MGLLEEVPEGLLGAATRSAILGDALRRLGRREEALAESSKAKRALGESTDRGVVWHVALLMESLGQDADAFELWRRVVLPEFVAPETIHLLKSARLAGDDKFVLDFCRRLRVGGHYDYRSLAHEVEVLANYSEFQAVRGAFLDYLKAKPDDKIARLKLTLFAIQLGWNDLVERDPSRFPTVEELSTAEIGAGVADALRAGPDPAQAVDYAYDLYRRFPEEAAAHQALIVAVLLPGPGPAGLQEPVTVAPGVAVCYCEVGREERRWLVVEDSVTPRLTRNEYPGSHALVKAMLGKSVRDEFPMSEGGIRNPIGMIIALVDKRVYRARELLSAWKDRFPDKPIFEAVPVRVSDSPTPEDFAELTKIMKRLTESRETVQKAYTDGKIPIATLAKLNRKPVFETVKYLAASRALPVRACRGTIQDRTEAVEALGSADTVVLGPSTIATLALIEELDLLDLLPFTFLVTEGTVQELRYLCREDIPKASGYMGYRDGHLWHEEVGEEWATQERDQLKAVMSSLEQKCEIIGGGDLAGVDASIREQLSTCFATGAVEGAAAASRRGTVFWTDDHLLYELVKDGLPALRVWTDVVFMWASGKGLIEREHWSQVIARLLRYGYFFTSSSAVVVLDTCEATSWRPENPDLAAVLADFGNPAWSDEAVQQTIALVWREAPTVEHARVITARLLTHLADRPDHDQIIRSLLENTNLLLGLAIMRAGPLRQVLAAFQRGGALTL